ncbi:MAG TPA: RCC1 domain-containing protein, partial [Polyangiaceae bacterium]|nr:RCC1 domain-containing protein [Polyangiaceae bacterium]
MMDRKRRIAFAFGARTGAFCLTLWMTACGTQDTAAPSTGALELALSTQAGSTSYRLISATFDIAGPEHRVLTTGWTSTSATLHAELIPGTYQVTLQSGWQLQRESADGSYATVDAQLVADTLPAAIAVDQTTKLSFRFVTEQGVVDFAEGTLEIGIDVEERVRPWRIVKLFGDPQLGCAVLQTGAFRCWGGDTHMVEAVDLDVGGLVDKAKFGTSRSCLLLTNGALRCWDGQPLAAPAQLRTIDVGGSVRQFDLTDSHVCAVLDSGSLRCWGDGFMGALGYGNRNSISEQEITSAGDVPVGGPVSSVGVINEQTCALMQSDTLRCWGFGYFGNIGDDEPAS